MMRSDRVVASCLALSLLLVGCTNHKASDAKIEGARYPDDEGVASAVSLDSITLDGMHTYSISTDVKSFSTYNQVAKPILFWKGKYIQIGLGKEKKVVWIAGIGQVNPIADPPVTYYVNAKLIGVDSQHRAIFRDGTVLRVASGVSAPKGKDPLLITIDVKRHVILKMEPQSSK